MAALMILALIACVLGLVAILETVRRRVRADRLANPISEESDDGEGGDC